MSHELFTTALLFFTSFFAIINPLGVMPVFMTMTADISEKQRKKTALKAVFTAFFILLLFAFGGQLLFKFFGISANGFRIVGGVIFFIMGFDMLHARISKIKMDDDMVKKYVDDISVTPLAIPMIAGPGAITNSIVLMEDSHSFQLKMILILSIVVTLLITYIVLLGAGKIIRLLGETGNKILMKLMGLIMMVIAVEFFFAGLRPIVQSMLGIVPN
ncbi:MAG: antibiotic resistance protein MarC [Bacteroidetes bacterium HGW-Bacteroidetes-11]|jgi:multiple antibiotic resistance protein|nr:MAG: antibiotic resistance protein MarC [Bacteroidetes bacterium HGW-Bacteroidetes-11]